MVASKSASHTQQILSFRLYVIHAKPNGIRRHKDLNPGNSGGDWIKGLQLADSAAARQE